MLDSKYVRTGLLVLLILLASAPALTPVVKAQGFFMSLSPYYATVKQGGTTDYVIGITSYGGFSDYVTFSGISGLPSGVTGVFNPASVYVPSGATVYSYVTIAASSIATVTTAATFTVTGWSTTWGSQTATAQLNVIASTTVDFSIVLSPNTYSVSAGQSVPQITVTLTPSASSTSSVTLSIPNLPSGSTAYFNPSTVTFAGVGSVTSYMTITTGATLPTGTYYLAVTGTNGTIIKDTIFILYITGVTGTFTLSASPSSRTVTAGQSTDYTVTITSQAAFSQSVDLSLSGQPSGVTGTFSPDPISVPSYTTKTSTLTINVASTAAAGTYTLTITGTYGATTQTRSVTLTVQTAGDFSISASPTSLSIVAGQTGTSTITITSTGSFSSAVSLLFTWTGSPPTGVTPSLSAYSVTPPAGSTATSTLTIATSSTTAPGTYVVKITGVSGVLTHSVDVTFTVTTPPPTPDFTMSVSPSSAQIGRGRSGNFTITIVSSGGFASPVSLTLSGQPTDVTGTFTPSSVTPPSGGSATSTLAVSVGATATPGSYTLTITGTSGSLSHQTTIAVTVPQPSGCIVATATYGSELSPEVQFLRGFRDGTVMSTFAGSEFMKAFNAWYYSFSPYIADFISKQPLLKEAMKILLYPLIGILHISALTYSALNFNPELAIVATGLVASGLIGIIYFAPFSLITLLCMRRRRKFRLNISHLKGLTAIWIASIALICLAEATGAQPVMMVATAILVLSTLTLAALATTQRVIQKLT